MAELRIMTESRINCNEKGLVIRQIKKKKKDFRKETNAHSN